MSGPHATGRVAEDLAAARLASQGWTVIGRNFRDGPREIDLIARRDGVVAFIEVKARRSALHHHPLDAIGHLKRRDLARAARRWIRAFGHPADTYRFDAIAVLGPRSHAPRIDHIEDAWRL
jgi:putative endonuclease